HPSARWNRTKAVWHCDVCGAEGGVLDLARRLGLSLAERLGHVARKETGRWMIRGRTGRPVAVKVRLEPGHNGKPQDCVWERPDGRRGLGAVKPDALPLYGTHELASAPPGPRVVVEGEKARDRLAQRGVCAVGTVTGASGTPTHDVLGVLVGADVVLWPDADAPGRAHMCRIGSRLTELGISPRVLSPWPGRSEASDAAGWADSPEPPHPLLPPPHTRN